MNGSNAVPIATPLRVASVALCFVLNVMDGYDILVMAFAAPAIKVEWGLSAADVGFIFAAGLAGMGLGGTVLAPLADFLGRRHIILGCLILTTTGMLFGASAESLAQLLPLRFITGLGVGGMMPTVNTIMAEYIPGKRRNLAIVLLAAGYPLGGMLGGLVALQVLDIHGWQSLLLVGGVFSALLLPAAYCWIPESPEYLVNRLAPESRSAIRGVGPRALLRGELLPTTLAIAGTIFCVQFTFYYVVNWAPMLLTRAEASELGISGAVLLNLGGIVGDILFGLACLRWSARRLGALAMLGCFVSIVLLSSFPHAAWSSSLIAALIGCCLYASMASLYAIAPAVFPALARASGTGIALSGGRVGGVLGPWAGALLIASPLHPRIDPSVILAAPLLLAAMILSLSCLREKA